MSEGRECYITLRKMTPYLIVYRPVVLITHPGHDQNGSLCQNDINTEP